MKYLLDTCVLSELVKPRPEKRVADWVRSQPEENLYLGVLTLGEITRGINRLPDGRKRRQLESWMEGELKPRFTGRCLAVDADVAERWGVIKAQAESDGRGLPVIDGLLAATALVHGMTFVTRNVDDVRETGVPVLNPWDQD